MPQFPPYLCNAEVLSYQTSQSSWFFLHKKTHGNWIATTGFLRPKNSRDFRETGHRLELFAAWLALASVNDFINVSLPIIIKQWLALTMLRATRSQAQIQYDGEMSHRHEFVDIMNIVK